MSGFPVLHCLLELAQTHGYAGAGVGFAFIPNPAKIGTGLAIGIPVGAGVGLVTGLITPGLHYRAKCGERVYALLLDEFTVCECRK